MASPNGHPPDQLGSPRTVFASHLSPALSTSLPARSPQRNDILLRQTTPFAGVDDLPPVAADTSPQPLTIGVHLNQRHLAALACCSRLILAHGSLSLTPGASPLVNSTLASSRTRRTAATLSHEVGKGSHKGECGAPPGRWRQNRVRIATPKLNAAAVAANHTCCCHQPLAL